MHLFSKFHVKKFTYTLYTEDFPELYKTTHPFTKSFNKTSETCTNTEVISEMK